MNQTETVSREYDKPDILVVDDITKNIREMEKILTPDSFFITAAMDGNQALLKIREKVPDLVLLDVMLPGMDGIEVCRILKQHAETKEIPVVLMTVKTETEDIVKGFLAGADDYIMKPFEAAEVLTKIQTHLDLKRAESEIKQFREDAAELTRERDALLGKNKEILEELRKKDEIIRKMNTLDGLTELYNYRYTMQRLAQCIDEARRYRHPLSILLLDIDLLKQLNGTYGHEFGDKVIVRVSRAVKSNMRKTDIAGRYSGEGFLVILPHAGIEGGMYTAERIRSGIEKLTWGYDELTVTVSGGISSLSEEEFEDKSMKTDNMLYRLIMNADEALYHARKKGGNRIN